MRRLVVFFVAAILLLASSARAQYQPILTTQQRTTLKAAIVADPVANACFINGDLGCLAVHYNTVTSPTFFVYRTNVPVQELVNQITWQNFTPSDPVPVIPASGTCTVNATTCPAGSYSYSLIETLTIWSLRAMKAQGQQMNLQNILLSAQGFLNAANSGTRNGLNDALTGIPSGATTSSTFPAGNPLSGGWVGVRDNVLARAASRIEKLLATTTVQQDGSTAAKAATMVFEGPIPYQEFSGL